MLGIIAAMEEELNALLTLRKDALRQDRCGMVFYTDGQIVAALSGIGKVNAALCAQTMILSYGVDAILNIGSAGGLAAGMEPGDLVIADAVAQHDLKVFDFQPDTCACDPAMIEKLLQLSKGKVYRGIVASGDHFVSSAEEKDRITGMLGAVACDMEAASIGRACALNGVPFAVVRAISDSADENAVMSFDECLRLASERSAKAAISYIEAQYC